MTTRPDRFPASQGFTLIEVLVALAIVAISLSAILASVTQQVNAAQAIRERTFASWVALNKLAELRLSSEMPDVGEDEDEVRYAEVDWKLTTTVSETGVENLRRVDVRVSYAASGDFVQAMTGFVGEPGIPGQSNLAWIGGSQALGAEQ